VARFPTHAPGLLAAWLIGLSPAPSVAQADSAAALLSAADLSHAQRLREAALQSTLAYELVASLTTEVGPRPAGSPADARAVAWAVDRLKALGLSNVRAEPVPLKAWQRGAAQAQLTSPFPQPVVMTALGNSVATPPEGLHAEVAYYSDLAALRADTGDRARGRIVFIDEKTERTRDGAGYGRAVAARAMGAIEAGKRGAVAVAIRSIGTDRDRLPHTGAMRYQIDVPSIPAFAVSVPDADQIARLAAHPATASRPLKMHVTLQAESGLPAVSHNVIGEVPGTDLAQEVVLLGAHLDSWDLGTGAVDDAAGVGIVTAAAKAILDGGTRPRRTVRVVLFANEENGFDGAFAYGARYREQPHQWVGESDFGAGPVWRMRSRVLPAALTVVSQIAEALAPLGIAAGDNLGNPGPDAAQLMRRQRWPGLELGQDGSDYFDWHHTANDTLDKVNRATLPQNVAAWAVATWLAAQSPVRFGPLPPATP
jgi:carboxypeptidase Q